MDKQSGRVRNQSWEKNKKSEESGQEPYSPRWLETTTVSFRWGKIAYQQLCVCIREVRALHRQYLLSPITQLSLVTAGLQNQTTTTQCYLKVVLA